MKAYLHAFPPTLCLKLIRHEQRCHVFARDHVLLRPRPQVSKFVLAAIIAVGSVGISFAGSNTSFSGDRVTVSSDKSFEDVTSAVKSLVAKNGMMVMAEVNQGKMLSMTGLSLKATLFVVGNPTVGKQLFEHDHGVGLYVPLRVLVYSDASGKTFVS